MSKQVTCPFHGHFEECDYGPCNITVACYADDRHDEEEKREWEAGMSTAERKGWMRARDAGVD